MVRVSRYSFFSLSFSPLNLQFDFSLKRGALTGLDAEKEAKERAFNVSARGKGEEQALRSPMHRQDEKGRKQKSGKSKLATSPDEKKKRKKKSKKSTKKEKDEDGDKSIGGGSGKFADLSGRSQYTTL